MTPLDIIIVTLSNIICVIIGVYVGKGYKPPDIEEVTRALKKRTGTVGTIDRPSAAKVIQWSKPTQEEEDESFKESFIKQTGRKP
jgi:hypothetical protein